MPRANHHSPRITHSAYREIQKPPKSKGKLTRVILTEKVTR